MTLELLESVKSAKSVDKFSVHPLPGSRYLEVRFIAVPE